MSVELNTMSLAELKKLAKDVDKAIAAQEKKSRKNALAEAKAVAAKHGLDLSDLLGDSAPKPAKPAKARAKAKGAPKPKSKPRYANPADPSQTWTGRGRRPEWVNAGLATGKSLSDFAI